MSNGSPSAYLLWAILASVFQVFLILHLWMYDRFKCLKWDAGRQPGAFKRAMTYSYIGTLPCLVVFAVAMAIIKYKEGYVLLPNGHVAPRPFQFWDKDNRSWVLPLYFVLSFGWALELITHLEELTFWLFLLHQGPRKREWFRSWEFRVWYLGSIVAILGMPLCVLIRRKVLETCQAWIFLSGSSAGTVTTVCFIYVLFRFPRFIRNVKAEGAAPDVIVRLTAFYQLNIIRVVFRFFFNIPLLILGVDGVHAPHPVARDPFASDFLLMVGGIGCFASSSITLLIFFPRSITKEAGYSTRVPSPALPNKSPAVAMSPLPDYYRHPQSPSLPVLLPPHSPDNLYSQSSFRFPRSEQDHHSMPPLSRVTSHRRYFSEGEAPQYESDPDQDVSKAVTLEDEAIREQLAPHHHHPPRPASIDPPPPSWQDHSYDRHRVATITLQEEGTSPPQTMHPYIMNFTSPIDLLDTPDNDTVPRAI